MSAVRLTKRIVDALRARDKVFIAYDLDLKGFGVRMTPAGAKTFVLEYRPGTGGRAVAKKRLSIGSTNILTPEQARRIAKDHLAAIRGGADPLAARAAAKNSLTVDQLGEMFLSEHIATKRKKSTLDLYSYAIRKCVSPAMGRRAATEIVKADVLKLHHSMRDRPVTANRTLAALSSLFAWAGKVETGYVPEGFNPAARIEKNKEQGRERFLSTVELERLGKALDDAETIGLPWDTDDQGPKAKHLAKPENRITKLSPYTTAAIRLLILTGCRLREILHLRWGEVDFERGLLFLPDSKTGRKTIILNGPALSILSGLPQSGTFVIAGASPARPRSDLNRSWTAVRRRAGLDGLRLHDLRHSFASVGVGAGLGLPIVGKLLGHTQASTTNKYAHLDADPLRRVSEIIGAQIDQAMRASERQQ
jgi:integrase